MTNVRPERIAEVESALEELYKKSAGLTDDERLYLARNSVVYNNFKDEIMRYHLELAGMLEGVPIFRKKAIK